MPDTIVGQARERFFRTKHAGLAPAFERLHEMLMGSGPSVLAYMPTIYVAYQTETKRVFAAVFVRPESYLELSLSLPTETLHPRLHVPAKTTWRSLTRSIHVESPEDVDNQLT